jgi:hypothetical protein
MKTKQVLLFAAAASIALATTLISCSKSTSVDNPTPATNQQSVSLYLTDGAGIFDSVFLNIKSIELLVDTSTNTRPHDSCNWNNIGADLHTRPNVNSLLWDTLNFNAGIYNLLQLKNGVDTLLSTSTIPAGAVRLIRIDFGSSGNYVVVDSIKYPLTNIPPYILLPLLGNEWQKVTTKAYRLWLDFDILHSIVYFNGSYHLAPVLRPFVPSQTGTVFGNIAPKLALSTTLRSFSSASTDTLFGITNPDGTFKFRGLKDGTYSLLIHSLRRDTLGVAINPFRDSTVTNISVQNANTVNVGTITLHN